MTRVRSGWGGAGDRAEDLTKLSDQELKNRLSEAFWAFGEKRVLPGMERSPSALLIALGREIGRRYSAKEADKLIEEISNAFPRALYPFDNKDDLDQEGVLMQRAYDLTRISAFAGGMKAGRGDFAFEVFYVWGFLSSKVMHIKDYTHRRVTIADPTSEDWQDRVVGRLVGKHLAEMLASGSSAESVGDLLELIQLRMGRTTFTGDGEGKIQTDLAGGLLMGVSDRDRLEFMGKMGTLGFLSPHQVELVQRIYDGGEWINLLSNHFNESSEVLRVFSEMVGAETLNDLVRDPDQPLEFRLKIARELIRRGDIDPSIVESFHIHGEEVIFEFYQKLMYFDPSLIYSGLDGEPVDLRVERTRSIVLYEEMVEQSGIQLGWRTHSEFGRNPDFKFDREDVWSIFSGSSEMSSD